MTLGLEMSSHAMAKRRRSPPEIPRTFESPTMVSAAFSSLICVIKSSTRSARDCLLIWLPSLSSTLKVRVSRTVMCGKNETSCSTKAQGTIESPVNKCPLMYRLPSSCIFELALILPARAWSTVDFPAPLGPIIANIRPGLARPRILPSRRILFPPLDFCPLSSMRISLNPSSTDERPPLALNLPPSTTISSSKTNFSSKDLGSLLPTLFTFVPRLTIARWAPV
mmetsp:Transcript_12828/g.25971  ORF Transcript_12828/g.25971 Transcript_12828/m.25971 type:complete len:224 (-) Transcript_12828:35-706(-)